MVSGRAEHAQQAGSVGAGSFHDPSQSLVGRVVRGEGQQPGQASRCGIDGDIGQYRADRAENDCGVGVQVRVDGYQRIDGFCEDGHASVAPSG